MHNALVNPDIVDIPVSKLLAFKPHIKLPSSSLFSKATVNIPEDMKIDAETRHPRRRLSKHHPQASPLRSDIFIETWGVRGVSEDAARVPCGEGGFTNTPHLRKKRLYNC
jgi:hypothetical protein